MLDKPSKISAGSVCVLLFLALLLFGVWTGCMAVHFTSGTFVPEQTAIFLNGMFEDVSAGYVRVFSAFLFDFLFYLLLVFLFGMTFLGVGIIPATVFVRGFTLGAALSGFLAAEGTGAYFQRWITYLPAAVFCTLVFLFFSGRTFSVSLKSAGLLFGKTSASVSVKKCGEHFLFALLLLLCAAGIRCGLVFLSAIFF